MIAIFPEIASAVAAKDVERLAILIRRYYGGPRSSAPAPDMRALLSHVGVIVREHNMTDHGALLAKDEHGAFRITAVVAAQDRGAGPETERFLLAHLLGHYLYDVQPLIAGGDWTVAGFREELCPARRYGTGQAMENDAREDRADRFAAALLMPLGMARRAWEKLEDVARVAQFFMVPLGVAARRLEELSLLSASPANFLDAERRMVRPGASCEAHGSQTGDSLTEEHATVVRTHVPASPNSMERTRAAQNQGSLENSSGARALESRMHSPSRTGMTRGEAETRYEARTVPAPPLPEERSPPRSFAASTYRATERLTRVPPPEESRATEPESTTTAAPASSSLKGLERIREIARKLDKTRSE